MVQPITSEERGWKRLAQGALGPWALGVGSLTPRAPRAVQVECRLAWRTDACLPKDQPWSWLRLLSCIFSTDAACASWSRAFVTSLNVNEWDTIEEVEDRDAAIMLIEERAQDSDAEADDVET